MTERVLVGGLSVAKVLYDFVNREALPGTGVSETAFWTRLDRIVHDLSPKNRALLKVRDEMQAKIDAWHRARRPALRLAAYKVFLADIGYLLPEARTSRSTPRTWMTRSHASPARSWWCRSPMPAMR